ncbi:MAG TPA: M1 family aminopeptidase [Bacteroidales bacterium]|nr:M1 family aminopeptidase [Bacteroidales bacterium]
MWTKVLIIGYFYNPGGGGFDRLSHRHKNNEIEILAKYFSTMKIKNLLLIPLFLTAITAFPAKQSKAVSDSVDVLNYSINLDLVHLSTKTISGFTTLTITPNVNNLSQIKLDLLKLNIDSINFQNNPLATFTYNDTVIRIDLPYSININDTVLLSVHYHGIPQVDESGWGGFYFTNDSSFAYNLGVGFQAVPHNYGRVWFPCLDDFVDRATYDCFITVKNDKKAVCGGTLMSVTDNGNNSSTFHWKIHATIPTYLASVAVGDYVSVTDTFNSMSGKVPINIYVRPSDTTLAKGSFINLKQILAIFENRFGPYRWERVGYVGVPFNSGAMEHSTNIAYPLVCINGNLTYESLYAHELSHQWFGDLVTCSTALDMWINEGWARYCESVYMELLYGTDAYKQNVRENHFSVITEAHVVDQGYRAVYGIPDAYTYSNTVYDKGADVVHTLRNYLGDSVFFAAVKAMTNDFQFRDISSAGMRDYLSTQTGVNLNDFFQAWVFSPGFPHFSIDSFVVTQTSPEIKVRVYVRQRLHHAPALANSNRVEITFGKNNWQLFSDTIQFSGSAASKEFVVPFIPDVAMMDFNEKTSDAITDMYKVIKTTGTYDLPLTYCRVDVSGINDSALVRVEHNWVAPDPLKAANPDILRLSDVHYWKVDGIFPENFIASARFKYNRNASTSTVNIDNILLPVYTSTDSLLLLYRPNTAADWSITHFSRLGPSTVGYLIVDTLRKGEYCFAVGTPYVASVNNPETPKNHLEAFPNPSNNSFTFSFDINEKASIKIYDVAGNEVSVIEAGSNEHKAIWQAADVAAGTYYARLFSLDGKKKLGEKKLVLIK